MLNTVNFNGNETQYQVIHNLIADPTAADSTEGQIYYNTNTNVLKVCTDGLTPTWVTITAGGVSNFSSTAGTYISLTNNSNATGSVSIGTVDLSAVDGTSVTTTRFLSKDNTWDVPSYTTVNTTDGTYINLTPNSATSGSVVVTADLSAVDGTAAGTTRFLDKNNKWSVPLYYTDANVDTHLNTSTATNNQILSWTGSDYDWITNQVGTVTSVDTGNSTFISGSGGAITASGSLTYSLSATGTPSASTFLAGNNTWSTPDYYTNADVDAHLNTGTATSNQILSWTGSDYDWIAQNTGDITAVNTATGSGLSGGTASGAANLQVVVDGTTIEIATNTIQAKTAAVINGGTGLATGDQIYDFVTVGTMTLTNKTINADNNSISNLEVDNFKASAIVTEAEGIAANDNDTTIPTSAAVKDYVDTNIVGQLIYQGGYNAATNTPDLDSSPSASIKTGWTYTVTADGTFFTEQVRVGDVLIAETDAPTTLADWTTVQNNIDLASLTTVGIGNVNPSAEDSQLGVTVSYSSGTADVGVDPNSLADDLASLAAADNFLVYDASASKNKKVGADVIATYAKSTIENRDAYVPLNDSTGWISSTNNSGGANDTISWTIDISGMDTAGVMDVGTNDLAIKVEVICLDATNTGFEAYQTLNPSITRAASGDITIEFIKKNWPGGNLPGQGDFAALLTYVGPY